MSLIDNVLKLVHEQKKVFSIFTCRTGNFHCKITLNVSRAQTLLWVLETAAIEMSLIQLGLKWRGQIRGLTVTAGRVGARGRATAFRGQQTFPRGRLEASTLSFETFSADHLCCSQGLPSKAGGQEKEKRTCSRSV